jgi:aldose sugar dehydrogenase
MHLPFPSRFAGALVFVVTALAGNAAERDAVQLYAQLCANCHGDKGQGSKASSLLDAHWQYGGDDAAIARNILKGIPESGMPDFAAAISEGEARAMVVYLRETARRNESPEPRKANPLPTEVQTSQLERFKVESVAEGLDVPWSITFLPGNRMLVTERVGRVRLIEDGKLHPTPVAGVPPVWVRDEGGLLSVAASPDFETTNWVYLSFSDKGPNDTSMTKVIRARFRDHALVNHEVIFRGAPETYTNNGTHFGCRLLFHGEHLFFTVGERGRVGEAQDVTKPNGKVHRVYWNGRIPADNPFARTAGAFPSIWSIGNRNPQGLAIDLRDESLWETEHGPRGGDELNHIVAGRNYGWPLVTYGMNYNGTPVSPLTEKEGLEPPAAHWTPSIATSPIMFYHADKFPRWRNELFLGSLAQQELRRITIENCKVTSQEIVLKHLGRVRDIQTGPDGFIYLALERPGALGGIIRLVPAPEPEQPKPPEPPAKKKKRK